jgi:transposase InsO family protein
LRDEIIDYIQQWHQKTKIAITKMLKWMSLSTSKYYSWQQRKGQKNQHNGQTPKTHWLLAWEISAIIDYRMAHLDEGYRRLSYMMLDENIVAVSPSSVYRVLKNAGLLATRWHHTKTKGSGFAQPTKPHEHYHMDISYINFKGTFVYLVVLIDGYSRFIVHHELKLSVESLDIEILMERAKAKFPGEKPVLITDNGPQFISKDFKQYLNESGITHRQTRFYYPQSNGKVERFMQTSKDECIRKNSFINIDDLKKRFRDYITYYNTRRLHSSLGYICPLDMLRGHQEKIFKERREKLNNAQKERKKQRQMEMNESVDLASFNHTERKKIKIA